MNMSKPEGSRWATKNLKDHTPMSLPETLSSGRIHFLDKIGHVFPSPKSDKTAGSTIDRPQKAQEKRAPSYKPKANWKDKRAAKFTCRETKRLKNGRWSGKFTSQGYPHESSEWEASEVRFVYCPQDMIQKWAGCRKSDPTLLLLPPKALHHSGNEQ
ncbi:hypothetical protein SEMRO_1931_G306140.1 [Seminavis robusta]|uniref:Uncharacterized protein n=1 Tax=Seminavis robusta TaxID=568900 RepID=A0A9N8EXV2_9STRA|nr:hypothetical protein SEMRO_1931_G306140.1 [Seminavis robusta]|eukprot:Sro1931_g306140.1 n/a (157) ;mRNA; r:1463-1933